MRRIGFGSFFTACVLAALILAIPSRVDGAAYQIDLCSRKTGKRTRVTVLKSNSEFLDVLNEDGEHIILQANNYEQCPAGPQSTAPVVVEPPVTPPRPKALDTLRITGSSTVGLGTLPYLIAGYAHKIGAKVKVAATDDPLRKLYELRNSPGEAPFLRIIVKSTGSNTALPDIIGKLADVGVSSRPYTDEEIAKLLAIRGVGSRSDVEHVIALDGIQFFVNRANPVTVLQICDVARLFSGKIKTWNELAPGDGDAVDVHTGDARSGTFEIVTENLLAPCGEKLGPATTPHNSQPEIIAFVAGSPGGLGYSAKALSSSQVKTIRLRGKCGIETDPTSFNIKAEDYSLSRRLYLFTPRAVGDNAQAFLDYVFSSDAAQSALKDSHATDQSIEFSETDTRLASARSLRENKDPLADKFAADSSRARRLSLSYRFASNNATLDTKAEQDIIRLVTYLRANRTPDKILLAGFADPDGTRAANQRLSQDRAEAVRREIARLDPELAASLTAQGYGSVMPVACNDTELGKAKNRRVEVWLKHG
ncbi:MAG: phosphate ABC transporter substrate-binding/OmpA family protein [Rhodomicrobium sp.]